MLKRGDVARVDYLWPHDEKAKRFQGTKDRACTVFEEIEANGRTIAVKVIPHHGILRGQQPDPEDMPYAVRLSPGVQRAVGLVKTDRQGRPKPNQKESWILAHRANLVHIPQNPAVIRTVDRNGNPGWSSGTMPEAVLKEIARKRELAKQDGVLIEDFITKSHKSSLEANKSASANVKPTKVAYSKESAQARRETDVWSKADQKKKKKLSVNNEKKNTRWQGDE